MASRIFTTKTFRRWMGKADVIDTALIDAIQEMEQGLAKQLLDLSDAQLKKALLTNDITEVHHEQN